MVDDNRGLGGKGVFKLFTVRLNVLAGPRHCFVLDRQASGHRLGADHGHLGYTTAPRIVGNARKSHDAYPALVFVTYWKAFDEVVACFIHVASVA
jgi:hypothetical protein